MYRPRNHIVSPFDIYTPSIGFWAVTESSPVVVTSTVANRGLLPVRDTTRDVKNFGLTAGCNVPTMNCIVVTFDVAVNFMLTAVTMLLYVAVPPTVNPLAAMTACAVEYATESRRVSIWPWSVAGVALLALIVSPAAMAAVARIRTLPSMK